MRTTFDYGIWIPMLAIFELYSLLISSGSGEIDHVDSSSNKVRSALGAGIVGNGQPNFLGCLPCSDKYVAASYFNTTTSVLDSDFHAFLAQKVGSNGSCKMTDDNFTMVGLSDLFRHLSGEGSHRQLVSTLKFSVPPDIFSWLDDHSCELLIIERLPVGVFADPFELQHLVQRREFLDASVFGDTNLELPSAVSNSSIVEIHIHIRHDTSSNFCETVVRLPLHARYPPLDSGGYAKIIIGKPDLFLRCRPEDSHQEACTWTVSSLDAGSTDKVMWSIPCGDGALADIVSSITFVSVLFCSLLIVFSTVSFSKNSDIKVS